MLRPYIMFTDARAPHPDWPRARVPGVAVARVAVPGSARLSGAASENARSQARRRRERGASRAGVGRLDEAGGVAFLGGGPPPPFTSFPHLSFVLPQRGDFLRYLYRD